MMLCSFMGTRTSVKTRNGSTYKGHTIGFSHMGDIALTDAKLEDDDSNQNPSLPGLIIRKDTFVVCKTNGVDLKGLCTSSVDFTDSGIVGRLNGSSETPMRELQPWDDEGAPDVNSTISLDDANDGWDSHSMFQANRDKFDVQTTYSDDLHEYTYVTLSCYCVCYFHYVCHLQMLMSLHMLFVVIVTTFLCYCRYIL
jgi:small nuclear ribonucleoprotein (snRNP)-like protein